MAQKKRRRPPAVKRYKHLTVFDRALIGQKHKEGMRENDIAKLIKRDRSTVIRELARNGARKTKRCRADSAHGKALARRAKRGVRPRLKNKIIRTYTAEKQKLVWSPEQEAIRLPIDLKGQPFSAVGISRYLDTSLVNVGTRKARAGHEDLRIYLARRHKRREKKGFRATQKLYHVPLPSIEDRPSLVD